MPVYLHCPKCQKSHRLKNAPDICPCKDDGYKFPTQGKKKYRVIATIDGRKKSQMCKNLTQAKALDAKWQASIVDGKYNLKPERVKTVAECWDIYLADMKSREVQYEGNELIWNKHLKPEFGKMPVDRVTEFTVNNFLIRLRKQKNMNGKPYSTASLKHIVGVLSRTYNFSSNKRINPCDNIKKGIFKLNNEITEYFEDDELQRLLKVLAEWPNRNSACFVSFLLFTGMRRGELFKLKWINVNLTKKSVKLINPKGGKDVVLPISQLAKDVLLEIKAVAEFQGIESDYVFYGKDGAMRKNFSGPWKRMKKETGINRPFRLHGLRHHFATALLNDGVDLGMVGELLTHKSPEMTKRYAKLFEKTKREALNKSDNIHKTAMKVVNIK